MSAINSVNIHSIDEERLKFRVIVAINARVQALVGANTFGRGSYDIDIPIPTSFTNSHEYSSCLIKCDTMAAWSDDALNTVSWGNAVRSKKIPALELQLTTPSSQATGSYIVEGAAAAAAANRQPIQIETQGFKQIITGQVVIQGNGNTWGPFAGPVAGQSWNSFPQTCDPIMCANPFGQKVTLRLTDPCEIPGERQIYIQDTGAAPPRTDQGFYVFQFDVQMVANK